MDRTGFTLSTVLGEPFTGARERGERPLVDMSSNKSIYRIYSTYVGGQQRFGGRPYKMLNVAMIQWGCDECVVQ